jgi:hypothetical protein
MSESFVYAITDGSYLKVGVARHPHKRLKELSTGNASRLRLIGFFSGGFKLEKEIHNKFNKVRTNGEWMHPTKELIEYLNSQIHDKFIVNDGVIKIYPKILI